MLSLARPAVDANNNPLGYKYTAAQVDAALHATPRRMYFRYVLLDDNNVFKKLLTTVTSGSITYDYTQQVKRTCQITLQDDPSINYLSDRIKPYALLRMPAGDFAQFPLGVFMLTTVPQQTDAALTVTRTITGYDFNQILVDWKTTDIYTIPAGTNYMDAVRSLLSQAGITEVNLTATSLTVPTDLVYQPGTSYLDIINGTSTVTGATVVMGQTAGLLEQINYRTLWFNENGVAQTQPWVNPSSTAPGYTYVDDSQSVIMPAVTRQTDLWDVPNVWVVVVSQTTTALIESTYQNTNANSPTSIPSRGREIVHFAQNYYASAQQTVDSYAEQLAFQDSQVYETITFDTAIIPIHEDYDVVQLQFSALGISTNYSEYGWSFPLQAGGSMSHSLRKIVPV